MSFASPAFLWYFMPATLAAYWLLPRAWRNGVLAVASLLFYAWGGGVFVLLLVGCMAINYAAGIAVDSRRTADRPAVRRLVLMAAVAADLSILLVWKYADFASRQLHEAAPAVPVLSLALPIGISFFTFHHLSYVVDVYRHSRPAQRSPVQFVTYIAMFPQLIAGPIVRYHEIAEQLSDTARSRLDDAAAGFPRFALGLAKKVVVADSVAPVANAVFAADPGTLDWRTAWIGALAYTVQIYFDFSGYSDMAIGLGRMFGFRLPENFDRPYSAASITDFWRRWHMSLSRWFRDYVYVPLGGNREGAAATYRNLLLVFFLCGFWHGANWTFLVWGLYHGALLVLERVTGVAKLGDDRLAVPRRAVTLLLVVVGWVFFRAASISRALGMLRVMLLPSDRPATSLLVDSGVRGQALVVLAAASLVVLLPGSFVMGRFLTESRAGLAPATRFAYCLVVAPYAAVLVAAGTFSPFLYFQF